MNKLTAERVTDAELIEALQNSGGIIIEAVSYIREHFHKHINRNTITERIKKSDDVRAARDEALDVYIDYAESKLKKAIQNDNLTAIIFFLKTIGKNRGYTERQQIEAAAEIRAVNPYEKFTREELREMLKDDIPK